MHVDFYEKVFLWLTIIVMVMFLVGIFIGVNVHGVNVPEPYARIDPQTLTETAPFDEPGVKEVSPGRYQVTFVAQMWRFIPGEVSVPVGSTVEFIVSSKDVIHGFWIGDTNVNAMVIPGEVTVVEHTFDEPGEYTIMCHEYCGLGHQTMAGVINVVDEDAGGQG
jgi:cytochrome c oxidase subunit 2